LVAILPKRYDMAMLPAIQRLIRDGQTDHDRRAIIHRIDRQLRSKPALAYRPAPTAALFHQCPFPVRWLLGGNRSGKSRSAAQEAFWYATGTHPYKKIRTPNVGWYSTVSWEMVGTVLWATLEPLLAGWEWRIPSWVNKGRGIPYSVEIKVRGGWSKILMKSYEQGREAYQGTERRWICNDEQFPPDIMEEQLSRIGPGDDLDFWAPMTPIDPQGWLEEKLNVERPHDWGVFEMPLDENRISEGGVIPDHRIDAAIESWPEEMRETRRKGKWSSFLGAVFKTFSREVHVVDDHEEEKKIIRFTKGGKVHGSLVSCGGIDFGGANPFVYLLVIKLPDDEWYVIDEYYWDYQINGIRLLREHARAILDMQEKWNAWNRVIWADHDKQDRFELADGGVPTYPADKGASKNTVSETGVRAASGKRQLIETIQSLLRVRIVTGRPGLKVAGRCKNLIRQLISNKWPKGTDTKDPADLPVKLDDHAVDALEYAIHSERGTFREATIILDKDGDFASDLDQTMDNLRW